MPPLFEVEALHKRFGETTALRGIDLEIQAGEIVAVLGPNGAGKTTLMSIVAGLHRPDSGRVRVAGYDVVRQRSAASAHVGFAPQDIGVYPSLSVRQNLDFFGQLAGVRGARLRSRIDEVCSALALDAHVERAVRELSGGEKRRVHTAIALLSRAPLVLLDEPTVGADVSTRKVLIDMVRSLAARGSAVCYCTHHLEEVESLNARVAILQRGRILITAPLAGLISRHGHSAVRFHFTGAPPQLPEHFNATYSPSEIVVSCAQPAAAVAEILAGLGPDAARVRDMQLLHPSLESAYWALTSHGPDLRGGDHVPSA